MANATQATFEAAKAMFGNMASGLKDLEWDQLPPAVTDYLKQNPGTSALQLVCLLAMVVPGVVAAPALLSLGFANGGPMTGWLAATFQSMYGTPVAFSALQSAAMGGWGAPIVNGVIQASATAFGLATEIFKWNVTEIFKQEL